MAHGSYPKTLAGEMAEQPINRLFGPGKRNMLCVVRVLQRSRAKRTYREIHTRRDLIQELAPTVMEAEKSYDVQSASWRTRNAAGVIQFKPKCLRTWDSSV